MTIDDKTTQVNSFGKGMNTDLSYQMIGDGQYTFAKNIRITALNQTGHGDITNGQGAVRPIEGVTVFNTNLNVKSILATNSIRHIGVIVFVDATDNHWKVGIFRNRLGQDVQLNNIPINVIYDSGEETSLDKFSTVVHYETYNLVKLYIADGVNPIKAINLTNGLVEEGQNLDEVQPVGDDEVEQYPNIIFSPLKFMGLTNGSLKAGMVQYAYRLYIKYGVSTDMSPVTNLIPLVHHDTFLGEEQGGSVDAGVVLRLNIDDTYRQVFNRILLYRIYYPQNDQTPTVSVFLDEDLATIQNGQDIIDDGGTTLQDITVEEFNNMTGLHVVPKILESKNDILFAAATVDTQTTVFEELTDEDVVAPLKYEFVQMDLVGDASPAEGGIVSHNTMQRIVDDGSWNLGSDIAGTELESDIKAAVKNNNYMYSDPGISYYARSLRRGETYRYGVVYYNNRGESSGVVHITDVYVGPTEGDEHGYSRLKAPYTFDGSSKYELEVHPIGVKFTVPQVAGAEAYEIVRCRRTASDTHNISQGVLSRPVMKYKWNEDSSELDQSNVYTPTGFLTMQDFYFGRSRTTGDELRYLAPAVRYTPSNYWYNSDDVDNYHADNYSNKDFVQFVSPEVCYASDDFKNLLKGNKRLHIVDNISYKSGISNKEWPVSFQWYGNNPPSEVIQYPAALHNANLLLHPTERINGQDTAYEVGIDYDNYPMEFYSARPGDIVTTGLFHSGGVGYFTYVNPTTRRVLQTIDPSTHSVNDDYIVSITGNDNRVITRIKPYVYAPIKLYNRVSELSYITDSHTQEEPNIDIKIDDSGMANIVPWNGVFSGENAEENVTLSYIDAGSSVVGTNEFCNTAIGGFYNERLQGYMNGTPNAWGGELDDLLFVGNGGKCALLKLDSDITLMASTQKADYSTQDLMYTYLCNITQDVIPYGGSSNAAKKLCTYYSHGQYFKFGTGDGPDEQIVFDGDTYIQPLEYVSMHKMYYGPAFDTVPSTMIIYWIPVETSINLTYTNGFEFSREFQDNEYITNIQVEPDAVYNTLNQEEPMYAYNMAYSSDSSSRPNASRTDEQDADMFKNMDYRVYYSNLKINGEHIDNWLHFDSNNFLDVDTKHGPITHMRNFHNKLIFWQEKATGVLSVNERAVLSVMENTAENKASKLPLVLGTGGVLERYDYLDDTTGMAAEQYCDTMSSSTLYWYDDNNREIKAYTDGGAIVPISKTGGVQNILHQYDDNNIPWMFYDQKYNEMALDVQSDHKMSLAYNEQIRAFTSVYDVGFDGAVQFKNGLYLLNVNDEGQLQIGEWNRSDEPTGFNSPLISAIQYVVNKAPLITKVFDNQELISKYGSERNDDESYFTEDHKYRWHTDLMNTGDIDNLQMTLREGNYRYAIPRENNAEYGSRIRGKYMICDIEDTSPKKDAQLVFVITKFRTSWI